MPAICVLDPACGQNTKFRPGKRGGSPPSAGQLGECRPHPLPLRSQPRFLLPVLFNAPASGNVNMLRPKSQDFPGGQWRRIHLSTQLT